MTGERENKFRKISRKQFLRRLGLVFTIPVAGLWYSGTKTEINSSKNKEVKLSSSLPQGISFTDDLIINHTGKEIKIFSSHCSHLGCRINKFENNEFICPCHGSRFNSDGKVIKGPAVNNLKELAYTKNIKTGELIIDADT